MERDAFKQGNHGEVIKYLKANLSVQNYGINVSRKCLEKPMLDKTNGDEKQEVRKMGYCLPAPLRAHRIHYSRNEALFTAVKISRNAAVKKLSRTRLVVWRQGWVSISGSLASPNDKWRQKTPPTNRNWRNIRVQIVINSTCTDGSLFSTFFKIKADHVFGMFEMS
ncbi:hypothetical protein CBL_05376 [Carabus blaptoides fortunei]